MCEFVSWIKYENRIYFLTDSVVAGRLEEFNKYNKEWQRDICGHGAIRWFYPELEGKGKNIECTSNDPKAYPKGVVEAIKECRLTLIGFNTNLLSTKGIKEYEKIQQPALAEYEKIDQSALAEYKKIDQSAWAEYEKIQQPAWAEYEKIQQPALAEYKKIQQPAWAEYKKIQQPAWAEYEKIQQPALAEYEKIKQIAFWKVFSKKSNRLKQWR